MHFDTIFLELKLGTPFSSVFSLIHMIDPWRLLTDLCRRSVRGSEGWVS